MGTGLPLLGVGEGVITMNELQTLDRMFVLVSEPPFEWLVTHFETQRILWFTLYGEC